MYLPPYIFFHSRTGCSWREGTDPVLHSFPTLNDAPPERLPSLTINVSQPDALMKWLDTNSAALITDLSIHLDATSETPKPQRWCVLFDKLQREATNIQNLSVYWDAEGPIHIGLGRSVVFVRGLATLKVKRSVEIAGFYAMHWPGYMEDKMGLTPVNKDAVPGDSWENMLRKYQRGTEHLNPWTDTEDGEWDLPRSFLAEDMLAHAQKLLRPVR